MEHYDAIIIGAGQAGIPLAKKLALAGKRTAIIEKRIVGGTCINDGCTPTKAMIASAQAVYKAKKAGELGIEIGKIAVDFKKIKARKDEIVKSFQASAQEGLESTKGLDLIMGEATFSGEKELTITNSQGEKDIVTADWIFINTGAKAVVPDIRGLEDIEYLTSTTILDLQEVPESLVIVGGNYIGLEFGQMFQRFGSNVTILERSPSIMGREDDDVSQEVRKILEEESLIILTNTNIESVTKTDGTISINLVVNGKTKTLTATHILVATGRAPQTATLNLEIPGVNIDDKGNILVNERLETNIKGIYALGDVNGGPAFTHIAYNDYTIVFRNLIEQAQLTTQGRPVPYCMFTDPQLGRIGISEKEAKERGLDYLVAKIPMEQVARGIETGETRGFMKAIVDRKSKEILGACILASEGGEIMAVLQMAMQGGITYDQIRYGVFAHPTYSESLNNLFMRVED
jgi:pyruvate/2-oxoglutarate dehydrogenase complex dihydrolipoamide dehydrogenase (E3) component